MATAEFTRWFLALFFLSVALFYVVRIITAKRKIGLSPVFYGEVFTLHWATHSIFRVCRSLILAVCLVRLVWPEFDAYLLIFDALWYSPVFFLGNSLLITSFFAIIALHLFLGEDWRSGTRNQDNTRLYTSGPFKLTRNPMMLCVIMGQAGLFLALPSMFTLVCLVLGVWAVNAQVRVEEELLQQRFGAEYKIYLARTPRWLFYR